MRIPLRWPLWFELEAVDERFAEQARPSFEFETFIAASPAWIYELYAEHGERFVPLTSAIISEGERLTDYFYFASFRHRVLVGEPGRRWVARAEATSMPLIRAMLQILEFEPAPGGATFRWRVYYEPRAWARPLDPLVHPILKLWLEASVRGLCRVAERGPDPGFVPAS